MLCTLVIILAVGSYITYQHLHPPGPPIYNLTLRPVKIQPLPSPPTHHSDIANDDTEEKTRKNNDAVSPTRADAASVGREGLNVFSVSSLIDAGNMERTQDPRQSNGNKRIQRQDDNPFMFYRVPPPAAFCPSPPPHGQCLPPAALDTLSNIKKCLKLNLLSLIIMGFVIPENILFIYTFAKDIGDICDEEGGVKIAVEIIIPLTWQMFGIIHPFLIKKKLDNFKS